MSRHGYTDDCEGPELAMYRGQVASATRGKRGQSMLRDLAAALDAMPNKRLIKGDLVTPEGECCAIGALLIARKCDDPQSLHEDNEAIAQEVNVAKCLVQEVEYMNDEGWYHETPEARWVRMRAWVANQIKEQS